VRSIDGNLTSGIFWPILRPQGWGVFITSNN